MCTMNDLKIPAGMSDHFLTITRFYLIYCACYGWCGCVWLVWLWLVWLGLAGWPGVARRSSGVARRLLLAGLAEFGYSCSGVARRPLASLDAWLWLVWLSLASCRASLDAPPGVARRLALADLAGFGWLPGRRSTPPRASLDASPGVARRRSG